MPGNIGTGHTTVDHDYDRNHIHVMSVCLSDTKSLLISTIHSHHTRVRSTVPKYLNYTTPTEIVTHTLAKSDRDACIVFDWDDTLLCTSHLASLGIHLNSDTGLVDVHREQLEALALNVNRLLHIALQYGPVTVITNAEAGWVQLSAHKFLPTVVPSLSKLTVLSARSAYETLYPDSPMKWKLHAFRHRVAAAHNRSQSNGRLLHVFSFGDSYVEREAVRSVTKPLTQTRCKSVKFTERPSVTALVHEVQLVCNCFGQIYNHIDDMDLQLAIKIGEDDRNSNSNTNVSDGTESQSMYDGSGGGDTVCKST